MKILLTGGTGMVGSALRVAYKTLRPEITLAVPLRRDLDLLDKDAVGSFLHDGKYDLVVHCAAKVGGIQANIADPTGFLYENIRMDFNLIQAAAKADVPELIYLGSSCMYPKDYQNPLKEEYLLAAPLEPTNEGYALAKIAGAKLCEFHNRQFGRHYKTLIPCNLYGPYDHFDPRSSHLVAAIINKLHKAKVASEPAVEIWGDGTARREFLYVSDLAAYIVKASGSVADLPPYLNLGFGSDHSIREYYDTVAWVVGFEGSFNFDLDKPVGMKLKLLDSRRAQALGWAPRTILSEGIRSTYGYFLRTNE